MQTATNIASNARALSAPSSLAALFLLFLCLFANGYAADPQPQPVVLKLDRNWHFAPDKGNQGIEEKWYAENFDDRDWRLLKSGVSWERQGIVHHGFGWYRQKLFIPKEYAGVPVVFAFAAIPSDDDFYVNGIRVGGLKGNYKYLNLLQRTYTVPTPILHYGQSNTVAIRVWGGIIGSNSGLTSGPYTAELDPYRLTARNPGADESKEQNIELFDLSAAQAGKPFEMVFRFPAATLRNTSEKLQYTLTDYYGGRIAAGAAPISLGKDGIARGVVKVDREVAQTIYLRGRFKAKLTVSDDSGNPLYSHTAEVDRLSFGGRDMLLLPPLADTDEETPYGRLKLIDEVDCSLSLSEEPHPYLESGFDKRQMRSTPGSAVKVTVSQILGRTARETEDGWFAYRLGRGKLEPHKTYLLRIEYPEDKPRYSSVEVQAGQNYMDIGWRNGVGVNDPYNNWPLSKTFQWYDVVVPLGDATVGTGGTGSASAEYGFWVYFMNKVVPQKYYSFYEGGPAISRIKLYEIDSEKNAPKINKPVGLPQRVLMFDWERQPEQEPADLVRYAKLMGYSAISPVIIKWGFTNYSEPLNGYNSGNVDDRNYLVTKRYTQKAGENVGPALQEKASVHAKYLEATRRFGINYVPRIEYGGSYDLPIEARAVGPDGTLAKPSRYAEWCANLLNTATWADLRTLIDHIVKPYAKNNPQLTGVLWRVRSNRMPVSYSQSDLQLFARETKTLVPQGSATERAAWASSGEGEQFYSDWWHRKREQFHANLVNLLKSYRPNMTLYYYNWDGDKFGLLLPDTLSWAFLRQVNRARGAAALAIYEKDRDERRRIPPGDYVRAIRSGDFGKEISAFHRPDDGLRTELYHGVSGMEIFAPANALYLADNPAYLDYFHTMDGLAVSNPVSYDEMGGRMINPKFEANMVTPAGPAFSMALEVFAYFYGDARTLTYTVYTYGRGFADAHRRFAQAFLALPAVDGKVVDVPDNELKIRLYHTVNGVYVGVAYKGDANKKLTIRLPGTWKSGASVKNLVTDRAVPAVSGDGELRFDLEAGPMELNALLIKN